MMATVHEQRHRMLEHALLRDPGAVVAVSIGLWQQLSVVLNQIIGERGVESMYARSLHQGRKQFAWLTLQPPQVLETAMSTLRSDLQAQSAPLACAASTAMLMHFIRFYDIDEEGLHVGYVLDAYEGILSGQPSRS